MRVVGIFPLFHTLPWENNKSLQNNLMVILKVYGKELLEMWENVDTKKILPVVLTQEIWRKTLNTANLTKESVHSANVENTAFIS